MGELSKKIGEQGEKIVVNFLDAIGWSNTSYAIDLPCLLNDKHKHPNTEARRTHSIDGLFNYETPLFENILEHVVISVKFSDKKYKINSNSDFKSHCKDLATALECYEKSDLQNEYSEGYDATIDKTRGLLIWIHNQDKYDSVVDKITTTIDNDLVYDSIYVLDNNRINFLTTCINLIKRKYIDYTSSFHYIDTGDNPSTINKQYDGEILPLQMLFSDVQIFKLENNETNKVTLVIVLKDEFEDNNLRRLIGLAHSLSKNFINVDLYFPNYDELRNILNSTNISDTDFFAILKNKGIYTNSNNREDTIPIFSSLIISPSEYDFLKDKQKTKEDKEKKRSSTIECDLKGKKLMEILPKINFEKIIDTKYMNYNFTKKTINFRKINDKHVVLEYKINRDYGNKSWFEKEKLFEASIDIKLNKDGLELTTVGTHTATETQKINNHINNYIINDLKSKQYIKKDKQIQKVTMDGLNNDNELIMKFFLTISTVDIDGFLIFDTLESLYIEIDETKTLPSDMDWMKSKIEQLKLDGKQIDKIKFINDKKFHQYLKCWSMISNYKFNDVRGIGHCKIKFEFHKSKDNEFEIRVDKLILENKKQDKKQLEKDISNIADKLKLSEYKHIKKGLKNNV